MSIIKPGYTRISNILEMFNDFRGIDESVLQNAADRGTRVHSAIDQYIHTRSVSCDLHEKDVPYFESWLKWYEDNHIYAGKTKNIYLGETRLYDEKRFLTGQFDGIYDCAVSYIVDWKTSSQENKLAWPLQGAAYVQLLRQSGLTYRGKLVECSDTVIFLKLDKNGDEPKEIRYELTPFHFRLFDWAVKQYAKSNNERTE